MTLNPDSAILWSSLGAYLEELAESGVDGFPVGDEICLLSPLARPVIPESAKSATVPSKPAAEVGEGPESLEKIRKTLGDCQRCKLGKTRKNLVFGVGNPQARLVFVGEGPGADEDAKGEPFVGAAGKVLNRLITNMGLKREEVYICNIVKCRPPGNRDPEPDEVATCSPFLRRQLQSINPEVIVALGKPAAQTLLGTNDAISRLRGKFRDFNGIPLMPTYHPSFLLRKQGEGSTDAFWEVWDDMTQVLRLLKLQVPDKNRKS
ncbi:MAG: uracil-DNA glycosylase [Geobacteraceae bacterium]|nr:uracil-DNA glycosylase [Geobacteraceae bacterium]